MKNIAQKIAGFAIAVLSAVTLVGCGSGNNTISDSGLISGAQVPTAVVKDIGFEMDTFGMTFIAPKEYESVSCTMNRNMDGTVTDKNIIFTLADGTIIDLSGAVLNEGEDAIALIKENIAEENLEIVTIDDYDFYVFELAGDKYAVAQDDKQNAYGLSVEGSTEGGSDVANIFKEMLSGIRIKKHTDVVSTEVDLGSIQYQVDDAWGLIQIFESTDLDKDGRCTGMSRMWKFGKSTDELDYRFRIQRFPNTPMEDVLNADNTYEDKEINGLTYKTYSNDDGVIEYTIQNKEDTYVIRNMGENNFGLFTNRSEESMKIFEEFVNTIRFK